MAKNKRYERGVALAWTVEDPASPKSGDPVRIKELCGVAIDDENTDGTTAVDMEGVYDLRVDDNVGGGIEAGDPLYYHDTATGTSPTTHVNNDSSGANAFFGYARETISAGGTETIEVLLAHQSLGAAS